MPESSTLAVISWISIAFGIICALVIIIDMLLGHRQRMTVMNIVWPVTGLYAGPLALLAYFTIGRLSR